MLRIVKNEELSALLENWRFASFDDADQVVAFETDGKVRALGLLYWKDEETIRLHVAYQEDGDDVAFINAFIPYAREQYPGRTLLHRVVADNQQRVDALRSNGFEVDEIERCWSGDPESIYDEDDEEPNPYVHLHRAENVMFLTYRERDRVEAVLTCDLEFCEDELGAAYVRSVCFRDEFDGKIYNVLFQALIRELWGYACSDLFVDDVPQEGESILEELGIKVWLEMIDCSVQL